jgi:hypothetical protein
VSVGDFFLYHHDINEIILFSTALDNSAFVWEFIIHFGIIESDGSPIARFKDNQGSFSNLLSKNNITYDFETDTLHIAVSDKIIK